MGMREAGVERYCGHAHSLLAAGKEEKRQEEQVGHRAFPIMAQMLTLGVMDKFSFH